jgi:tight adherence protein C
MELLSQLQALINEFVADPEIAQLGFMLMMGLAVFALLMAGLLIYLGLSNPVRRRVQQLEPQVAGATTSTGSAAAPGKSGRGATQASLLKLVAPMGHRLIPEDEEARGRTASRLNHAGFRAPGALNTYYGVKLALSLLLPTVVLLVSSTLSLPLNSVLLLAISAGIVGFVGPSFWLDRAVTRRTKSLRRGLPDTLDLLVVCTERGLACPRPFSGSPGTWKSASRICHTN